MQQYEKIGVFLTGSVADDAALSFAGAIAKRTGSKTFLVIYEHGRDGEADAKTVDLQQFEKTVAAELGDELLKQVGLSVRAGSGVADVLRCARDSELDLIVKGRRLPANQLAVGSVFARLARKAPCSVLVVPAPVRTHIERFLVPMDGSEHSKMALETALEMSRMVAAHGGRPQVIVHSVFAVGYGYHYTGMGIAEAAAKMEDATRKRLERLLRRVETDQIPFETVYTCAENTAQAVHDLAAARKVDIVMVGSRGLSTAAAAILGGTAEQILVGSALPVMIVKRKGETVGLLNALLSGA